MTAVKPAESLPAGGRQVEVSGAGFSRETQIIFGKSSVPVAEVLSPTRVMVEVPPGEPGATTLSARSPQGEYAGAIEFGYAPHPYLYYTEETLPLLRDKFHDPRFADYKRAILRAGDRTEPVLGEGKGAADNLYSLVGAWICTGDEAYKTKALTLVDLIIGELDRLSYGEFTMMSTTNVAIAYDTMFADLSQAQRYGLAEFLRRSIKAHMSGMPQANNDDQGRSKPRETWFYTNISNTNAVGNGGAGLACLALRHSNAMARQDLEYATTQIRKYAEHCIQPDGANVEGSFYASYGEHYYFMFAEALAHAAEDTQLLDMPNLEKHENWYKAMLGGNGQMYMYSDAYPHFPNSCHFQSLARHYDQDMMRWLAKEHGHKGWLGLLFRDEKPAPEQCPELPTLHVLESKSIAGLRSDPTLNANMTLCIKGNDNANSHHNHTDIGHMIMILNGEQILSDDGYINPSAPENHSLLMIDAEPPADTGGWITDSWEFGPWRAATMSLSPRCVCPTTVSCADIPAVSPWPCAISVIGQ